MWFSQRFCSYLQRLSNLSNTMYKSAGSSFPVRMHLHMHGRALMDWCASALLAQAVQDVAQHVFNQLYVFTQTSFSMLLRRGHSMPIFGNALGYRCYACCVAQ